MVHELSSYRRRNAKKKNSLSGEFQKRTLKSNTGGVHRTKLITSYREKALLVLDALCELGGTASTKQIKQNPGWQIQLLSYIRIITAGLKTPGAAPTVCWTTVMLL